MKLSHLLLAAAVASSTLCVAETASAENRTLWIHGRSSGLGGLPIWDFSYWNKSGFANNNVALSGINPKAVNYDATDHISTTNGVIVAALDANCTNGNSCYVVCHSAGCAQIGYAYSYAYYPGRWSVIEVYAGGSAAGGSELANAGSWLTGWNIDQDLHVGTMRSLYNHDIVGDKIAGYVHTHTGGDWSSLTNVFFPCHSSFWGVCYSWAGNDSVVAFHSAGHSRSSSGNQNVSGPFWDWTTTQWADANNGGAGHCINGGFLGSCQEGWTGGVMGVVSGTVSAYAR